MYDSAKTAKLIKNLRGRMKYTALSKAIEKKTGVYIAKEMLSKYERNEISKIGMSMAAACAIAEYFDISIDELAGRVASE